MQYPECALCKKYAPAFFIPFFIISAMIFQVKTLTLRIISTTATHNEVI